MYVRADHEEHRDRKWLQLQRKAQASAEREGGDRTPGNREGSQQQILDGLKQTHFSVKYDESHQTPGSCMSKHSLIRLKGQC